MAKSRETQIELSSSPDALLEILTSPDFIVERDKAQGALEVEVSEVSRSDHELVQRIRTKEYARGLTGIDKSKTQVSETTYRWDLAERKATWTWSAAHAQRVEVSGTAAIRPRGEGSVLDETMTIAVHMPLVGRRIEGFVMAEMDRGFETYETIVRKWAE